MADGWLVLIGHTEFAEDGIAYAVGPFPTPEAAEDVLLCARPHVIAYVVPAQPAPQPHGPAAGRG